MKKYFYLVFVSIFLFTACAENNEEIAEETNENSEELIEEKAEENAEVVLNEAGGYGEVITTENALSSNEVVTKMASRDSMDMKVRGEVMEVCQKKGCWMTMNTGNDEPMRIVFRDYGFFVPKDISGKTAVIEGTVYRKVTPVDELRHYAEDEGKSEEEIAAITEPREELEFVADGVMIM